MQHKHDASERHHTTQHGDAHPGNPLSRSQIQFLVPLVRRRARVDHDFRVGNDHFERGDAPVGSACEQVLDVVVRPSKTEERVGRVKGLVRRLRELRYLCCGASTRGVQNRVFVAYARYAGTGGLHMRKCAVSMIVVLNVCRVREGKNGNEN